MSKIPCLLLLLLLSIDVSFSEEIKSQKKSKPVYYTAIKKKDGIYLKASWHDNIAFGPFQRYKKGHDRFVRYPEGRKKVFANAQQIYFHEETGRWSFSDNFVKMRAVKVKPEKALVPQSQK